MAETTKKYLDQDGLSTFWEKVKTKISEEAQVASDAAAAAQSTADNAQSTADGAQIAAETAQARADEAYTQAEDASGAVDLLKKNLEDYYLPTEEIEEQAKKLTASVNAYTDTKVSEVSAKITALGSVMNYKGTKATKADLPTTGNTTGDVWHVTADSGEYAWDGSAWQELGSTIDLSGYEVSSNKTTSVSSSSTDTQYPSAKAVYTALSGKANSSHTHTIANITNLQTTLDGKAAKSHTHTVSQITDFAANIPINTVKLNGTALTISSQAVNVQAATPAQGALADTALQPSDFVAIDNTYINALS